MSHPIGNVGTMPDVIDIQDRFGTVCVQIDSICDVCGDAFEVYAGVGVEGEALICAGCGLPVAF